MSSLSTSIGSSTLLGLAVPAAAGEAVPALIEAIRSPDDKTRGEAWQGAASAGPGAIQALANLMADPQVEVARAARRALERIVRHCGRPGAKAERAAAQAELIALLKANTPVVRKEAVWMLSEIGDAQAVPAMGALLADPEVGEDARCAMLRMPAKAALKAFRGAWKTANEDFRPALAESLRQLGDKVEGYPSAKLVPNRQTTVGKAKQL